MTGSSNLQIPDQQQDLFEELNSSSYRDAQRQHWERIGSSYLVSRLWCCKQRFSCRPLCLAGPCRSVAIKSLTLCVAPLRRCCMGAHGCCPKSCMCSQCRKWHSHTQQCSRCKHACSSRTSRAKWTRCAVASAFDMTSHERAAQQMYIHCTIPAGISANHSVV